jgi:D-glycero-beta-D-manno-heptose-7-phosphate kinase
VAHDSMAGLVQRLSGQRVLVVGDVMLDEHLWGEVRRISPEAPVPVVELRRRTHVPGGAANAAVNAAGLEAQVALVGAVGEDESAGHLRRALETAGVDASGLVTDAGRPTTTKTRVIAHHQQVVRVDHEQRGPVRARTEEALRQAIEHRLSDAAICLLSDYAKGVVSAELAHWLIARCAALGKPILVDPKGSDFGKYRGATLVKPNLHEATLFLRAEITSEAEVVAAGSRLLEALAAAVLMTRGAEGMSLFRPGVAPLHVPALAREVYDVTGAGDTVAATLAVALAAGGDLEDAARLAARAAAAVVGRVGTSPVRRADLA